MAQKLLFCVLFSVLFSCAFVACQITNIECNQTNHGRHYPSGVNCSTFYTCFNRNFHLQSCPYPFWFSNSMQSCVVQDMSDCDLGPENVVCNTANHGRHFPTTYNCSSYYTCFDGIFYLQNCPDSFFFIDEHQSCMYVTDHICNIPPDQITPPTPTTTTTPIPIPTECPASGVSKMPNAYSCTNYFLCFAGNKIPQSCSNGLHFSRSQLKCVRPEQSDCVLPTTCPSGNDPLNIIFLPDRNNCQKYFICFNGNPQPFDCGATLHWDPNTNKCIREEDSQCRI
ncbi:hypothetical protein ACKWTF_004220 [Chironomus riparius]